jgi:hypothetical protein
VLGIGCWVLGVFLLGVWCRVLAIRGWTCSLKMPQFLARRSLRSSDSPRVYRSVCVCVCVFERERESECVGVCVEGWTCSLKMPQFLARRWLLCVGFWVLGFGCWR